MAPAPVNVDRGKDEKTVVDPEESTLRDQISSTNLGEIWTMSFDDALLMHVFCVEFTIRSHSLGFGPSSWSVILVCCFV